LIFRVPDIEAPLYSFAISRIENSRTGRLTDVGIAAQMKIWKQIVWSLVLAGGAFLGWAWFYPGAGDTLARYGIDWFSVSSTGQQAGDARSGGGAPRRGGFPAKRSLLSRRWGRASSTTA
jgi:hypothetical protein